MIELPDLAPEPTDEGKKKETGAGADPHNFGAAETAVNDAAKRVNSIWITFILLCVYVFIATYTVTPVALFRNAPVKLPVFNAELPLQTYFLLAPALIIALHAYLIVLLIGLAEKLGEYESLLVRPMGDVWRPNSRREKLRSLLDIAVPLRTLIGLHREKPSVLDKGSIAMGFGSMLAMPMVLLLLTQARFLPY